MTRWFKTRILVGLMLSVFLFSSTVIAAPSPELTAILDGNMVTYHWKGMPNAYVEHDCFRDEEHIVWPSGNIAYLNPVWLPESRVGNVQKGEVVNIVIPDDEGLYHCQGYLFRNGWLLAPVTYIVE